MVEGHRGSLICAECLERAFRALVIDRGGVARPEGAACALCLESRPDPHWASGAFPDVFACLRCVKQSAGVLQKDPESGWRKPAPPAGGSPPASTG